VSPRADPVWNKPPPAGYTANPAPTVTRNGDLELVAQPLLAGGGHATAWQEVSRGSTRTLYASVAWSHPHDTAAADAVAAVRPALVDHVSAPYRDDSAGIPRTTDMTALNGAGTGTAGFAVGIPGQDPPTPEVGNLTWALHNVWLSYRHTMDVRILRDVVYPL